MGLYKWIRIRRALGLILIVSLVMVGLALTQSINTYRQHYGGTVLMAKEEPQDQGLVEIHGDVKANKENDQSVPKLLQNIQLGGCSGNLDLIILVISEPRQHAYRNAIRKSWALAVAVHMSSSSHKTPKVELAFLMGVDADPMWRTLVAEEARTEGDVIQYDLRHGDQSDVIEDVAPLLWIQKYCAPFGNTPKYIMKCESTQYVNVGMVETLIGDELRGNLVIGDRLCLPTAMLNETYFCLQQNSYVTAGHLLSKLNIEELRNYKSVTPPAPQGGVFADWSCRKSAVSIVCRLSTEKCAVVSGLPHEHYKVIWLGQFSYDPSKTKSSC